MWLRLWGFLFKGFHQFGTFNISTRDISAQRYFGALNILAGRLWHWNETYLAPWTFQQKCSIAPKHPCAKASTYFCPSTGPKIYFGLGKIFCATPKIDSHTSGDKRYT
jgi:hypothetical protein